MNNRYYYKIRIITEYKDSTEKEEYLYGVYIDFDKAVSRVDRAMRDILEGIGSDHEKIRTGFCGFDKYWTSSDIKDHPKIENIFIETEQGERILG